MIKIKKLKRHEAITQAAYVLLASKGYDGTSMLSIAKSAKASNETLYRWYGDKRGLFASMVRDNAAYMKDHLERATVGENDAMIALEAFSAVFLEVLLGERAILLNRVAAADPSGELGAAISAEGRTIIQPLIELLISEICKGQKADTKELTNWYLSILIGDLQIKRVIGVEPTLTPMQIAARCQSTHRAFKIILQSIPKPT